MKFAFRSLSAWTPKAVEPVFGRVKDPESRVQPPLAGSERRLGNVCCPPQAGIKFFRVIEIGKLRGY
jgi:hypothetical protein